MAYEYYRVGIYEGKKLVRVSPATSSLEDAVSLHVQIRKEVALGQRATLLLAEQDYPLNLELRACDGQEENCNDRRF